jgi:hypothetical protein
MNNINIGDHVPVFYTMTVFKNMNSKNQLPVIQGFYWMGLNFNVLYECFMQEINLSYI